MTAVAFVVASLVLATPPPDDPCEEENVIACIDDGVYSGMTQQTTAELANSWPPSYGPDNPERWFQYRPVPDCPGNHPDEPDYASCLWAITYCEERVPDSSGPYSQVYRRIVDETGPLDSWVYIGHTCFTDLVPERSGDDVELTIEHILEQFHRTAFADPTTSLQPPDGRGLVNLPVYFELVWDPEGFEPMEIDTSILLGHEVRIRPTLQEVVYDFGDGQTYGPTTSTGGRYPDGDVTHTYASAGTVDPSITVVYGGQYSVDGGSWQIVPGSATVTGPAQPLEIFTSTNRLYSGP